MKKPNRAQCILRRQNLELVAWIPEDFCEVGKFLQLRNGLGTWVDGWQVISVGPLRPSDDTIAHERDYKNWRKATDV